MNKKEALEQCLKLWQHLMDNPDIEYKEILVWDLLEYEPLNYCPACEYTIRGDNVTDYHRPDCSKCPVDAWRAICENDFYACDNGKDGEAGDYALWCEAESDDERAKYAGNIVKLVEQSLGNLQ
jgi:hypothetical protein